MLKSSLLITLLLGGTGVSLISEQSVPGDFLYPVKLHVNENVKGALAIGSVAEARLALSLLQERLREVEVMAENGVLDEDASLAAQATIVAQSSVLERTVDTLNDSRQSQLRMELQASLEDFKNALVAYKDTQSQLPVDTLTDLAEALQGEGEERTDEPVTDIDTLLVESQFDSLRALEEIQVTLAQGEDTILYTEFSLLVTQAKSAFAAGNYTDSELFIDQAYTRFAQVETEAPVEEIATSSAPEILTPEEEVPIETP